MIRVVAAQTGIQDERLLAAFARVPRHLFVPSAMSSRAYEDAALPLSYNQTISQPSMIAVMFDRLKLDSRDRVLEVGAGSGYAAALLAQLVSEVFAVEILPELAQRARQRLSDLKIFNAQVFEGNGRLGLPAFGPYDKILVSAGSEDVPGELLAQLAPGGRMAIPVGDDVSQQLRIATKDQSGGIHWEASIPCIFVPLVGQA